MPFWDVNGVIQSVILCLAFSPQCDVYRIHSCCCTLSVIGLFLLHSSIPLYKHTTMLLPIFVLLIWVVSSLGYTALYFYSHMFSFLVNKCLELLGQRVGV